MSATNLTVVLLVFTLVGKGQLLTPAPEGLTPEQR
jgi:hypothetical protein